MAELCDDDVVHGDAQQDAQREKVVEGGKRLSLLPFVDGARFFKTEPALQVADSESPFFSQAKDVLSGGNGIDDGKQNLRHDIASLKKVPAHYITDLKKRKPQISVV